VIYEAEEWLVVNKPAGMLSHPSKPSHRATLRDHLQQLLAFECATGGQVSLVNRLDRETSGLVLVAKTRGAARSFGASLMAGQIKKGYLALVLGEWPQTVTTVDAPLLRRGAVEPSPVWLQRMVHPDGAPAVTEFERLEVRTLEDGAIISLVRAWPITGRTHQIRVHAAQVGHPILGDKLYPDPRRYLQFIETGWTPALEAELRLPRHALHADMLRFHECGATFNCTTPWPPDLQSFWPLNPPPG